MSKFLLLSSVSKDGTTATADGLLGADRFVREHLLGKKAAKPVFAGSTAYRALVPLEEAASIIGGRNLAKFFLSVSKAERYAIETRTY